MFLCIKTCSYNVQYIPLCLSIDYKFDVFYISSSLSESSFLLGLNCGFITFCWYNSTENESDISLDLIAYKILTNHLCFYNILHKKINVIQGIGIQCQTYLKKAYKVFSISLQTRYEVILFQSERNRKTVRQKQ